MRVGVDYYPEQWDRELWEIDAETMSKTGVKLIRIGEFAWQRLEPSEGNFNFDWLKEVIAIFARRGIGTVLSLPTACPPLWLYRKHPDIIRIGSRGARSSINAHRCVNSPVFRGYARKITEALVAQFGKNPAVVSWQIDYEAEAYNCTCDVCREKFRGWLLDKYGSVEALNEAVDSIYSDISEFEPPAVNSSEWENPSLSLEWYRFTSDCAVEFVRDEMLIIRAADQNAEISTNITPHINNPDFYKLFECLDYVSYDNFPTTKATGEIYNSRAFELDMMRCIKGRDFIVIEQLGSTECEEMIMPVSPKSGMIMGYAMQAMIRGANTVFHHRWRTALKGPRMFNRGILDHGNKPNRKFFEFSDLCRCVSKLNALNDTRIVSDAAIIYSPETEAAFHIQPQVEGFDYLKQLKAYHKALTGFGANVDVVSPEADLSKYKLVIAPSLYVNKTAATNNIYRYVMNGGTIVLTARSGVKNENNSYTMEALPTVFRELAGAEILDYDIIGEEKKVIRDFAGNEFECSQWCDILTPLTARAYAVYSDDNSGAAAVTMNRYCSGVAYYVGTVCGADFYDSFISNLMMQTGIPKLGNLPKGVEVTTRTNGRDDYICFFNNTKSAVKIPLPKPMYSMINESEAEFIELAPLKMEIVRK